MIAENALRDARSDAACSHFSPESAGDRERAVAGGTDDERSPQAECLAGLAHDLRTPLARIKLGADLLRRRLRREGRAPDAAIDDGLAQIEADALRMARYIDGLAEAGRAGSRGGLDGTGVIRRPTDLVAIARHLAAAYQRATDRHSLRVESEYARVVGMWDSARVERAVSNLLSNAVKYSPDGGDVVVMIWQEGDGDDAWASLSVTDRGVGIPADDLPHVFEDYHRGRNVGRVQGTGIGLATVHRTAEQHGGSVSVRSAEGRGSIITIRLPLSGVSRHVTDAARGALAGSPAPGD
jgi:signal transduction histidine kinase